MPRYKVGGPPENWNGLQVIDVATGLEVPRVFECDTDEGWCRKAKLDANGKLIKIIVDGEQTGVEEETIQGNFKIVDPRIQSQSVEK